LPVLVPESFHEQTDEELIETDIRRMDADDQAIQTILLGLPEDVYAAVDSCETAKEIWERFRQMMKGSDIEEQEKKAKLFNEWLVVIPGIANQNGTGNVVAASAEGTGIRNQARCYNCRGLGHITRICTARPRRRDAAYLQTQLLIAQKEETEIQLQAEEFDFMATAGDLDEIEEINTNCILMDNLQYASTFGTQLDKAPVYDTDGSGEVQHNDNCYDNEIFNMFTQEEQYTDLLEPIPKPQIVPQNDNHVTSVAISMVQSGGTVETSFSPNEETRAHQETIYRNLVDQVAQVNMVNCNTRSTNDELKSELARYKIQEQRVESVRRNMTNLKSVIKRIFVPQTTKSKEELFLSNVSNMVTVSKMISTPNEDLSDDTTPSVARKFLNEVHKIISYEIAPIINQVDARVQNFEIQFLQEAAKFVRDFKSCGKEADESLDNQKSLELEIKRLLKASIPSHSVPQPREFNVVKHKNVITPGMFKINPSQTPKVDLVPNKQSSASIRTNPITNSQLHVIVKEIISSNTVTASSTGLVHTARTRRPQPKGNTRYARVPSASKSSKVKKNVTVEDHHRTLLVSKNQKTMSSECNNIKLDIQNDKSETVCDTCKQCLATANHDACLLLSVNALNCRSNNMCANVPLSANQKRNRTQVVQICLWYVDSGCSKHMTENIKLLINFVWKFLGTVRFRNDHIAAILGYGDLKWGNITITRVYFVEGLGYNLFSVGQFCNADLEVAFRRNTCFIRDLDGVDLLKGKCSINLYTINLYDMASASPICLMAHATPTKSWLWHQRLSHLNFDTINDLAKNDLVFGLQKFKYAKEHLCRSYEQGKSKRASHPPKPVLYPKQRHYLLHIDLCGPMRVASINGKRNCYCVLYSKPFHYSPTFQKTPYELIQGRKPDISYLYVFGALCYPKNDREDIGKLGAKGDIGFFIGYSANSVAYRVYNRRTKKVMETMNVTFDELSAMDFEQNSSRLGRQMKIVTTARRKEMPLPEVCTAIEEKKKKLPVKDRWQLHQDSAPCLAHDSSSNYILFEPLHNEFLGGRLAEAPRVIPAAPVLQNL
nr:integrase, catalytic region, zinc finger, CCHC-type, peptidase aspartic, catalytic [Tanacetum cinerariifolium]